MVRSARIASRIKEATSNEPLHFGEITKMSDPLYRELETLGIPLDRNALQTLISQKEAELKPLIAQIQQETGHTVNPNRATDWQKIIEDRGGTMPLTPTGRPQTNDWAVKRLREDHPIVNTLTKAKKLYLFLGLLRKLHQRAQAKKKDTGEYKVHPTYKMNEQLGRMHSGGEANPMNWTKELQKTVAHPGRIFLKADYSAIELRVLQKLSGDKVMGSALLGPDYHTEVARDIFGVPNPSQEQRLVAKIVTYATMYGGGPGTVANPINDLRRKEAEAQGKKKYKKMSWKEAGELQDRWKEKFPEASAYIEKLAEAEEYATSYHGRQKKLTQPKSSDPELFQKELDAKKRLAVNSVLQNTAGDLARIGFSRVSNDGRLRQMGALPITTIHDAILLSLPDDADVETAKQYMREDLENIDPNFTLPVEILSGKSWGDMD